MGKRFAILIGAAALGAAVIAVGASADFRSVNDPRGDVKCIQDRHPHPTCSDSKKRNADIVRATAGHGKNGRLKHTIRVVGKFQRGVQNVYLGIDTDSDECVRYFRFRPGKEKAEFKTRCRPGGGTKRRAGRVSFHRHSVEILFKKRLIGNPRRYDWTLSVCAFAPTGTGSWACDHAPNGGRSIRHRLG
jgi:hypothetical protein